MSIFRPVRLFLWMREEKSAAEIFVNVDTN
jgi:hypothetical protein